MRNVLLTGASGFVGAAVARQMVAQGRNVALLLRSSSDTRRIDDILDKVTVIRGDMANIGQARDEISAFAPQAVAHLAWQGVKGADRNSYEQADNVPASVALYRLAAELGCSRFVGLGSQAEYGPCPARSDEQVPTRPTTVYGAAKLSTFCLLDRMAAADGNSFAWLRLFSSYGPGDDPSWLIPYMTLRLLSGEKPSLTKGEQLWDYIYVDDAAAAVVSLIDSDATGAFNLGSGQAWPLHDLITKIRDLIDPALPLGFGDVPYRPDQVMHLEADITALSRATGWTPKMPLDDGLKNTVDWYRNWKQSQ
ncbi:NAD-dependent epimerase/dehydratase family protein [Insolitispirillum peregrinum]|uniref:NAD-dependent epimerase/dehydratase family protein n=1 Tax=Insolitispirillum peregrinum TaxID=80876 RepID=UPI00361A6CDD